jgi:ATP-dependent RNA helicase RhlE
MTFLDLGLHPDLLRGIADLGFDQPTPIQLDAIPPALAGRDVLACAATGSGKTAAFLLPILERLLDRPRGTTRALVLAPTRELAAQIVEHCEALAKHTGLTAAAVFGGVAMAPQEQAFRDGVDVLVATPGRLLDHFANDYAALPHLEVLVVDEADRMLDMGFLPDVRRVFEHIGKVEQTFFLSATLPPPIVALAQEMLADPVSLNVERPAAPASGVRQTIYPVRDELKPFLLIELIRRGVIGNVLVFTRTKHRANRLAEILKKNGVQCDRIHGNRSQVQRTDVLGRFKAGELPVLVATDIAARGIDVEALSHVVNFDVPVVTDDYIHRVGRTGRAEAEGDAVTFVSEQELGDLHAIEKAVGGRLPRLTLEGFDYQAAPPEPLEIPLAERLAAIRERKADERARAKAKAERKAQRLAEERARAAHKGPQRQERQPRPGGQPPRRGPRPAEAHHHHQQRSGDPQHWPADTQRFAADAPKETAEERAQRIASTFSPTRFNRFRY